MIEFSPSFDCILPPESNNIGGLYLGDIFTAEKIEILKEKNISAVLTVASDTYLTFENTHVSEHKIIAAEDTFYFNLSRFFEEGYNFIEENRKKHNILVHCFAGVSRSATIVIAYLMKKNKWKFLKSLKFVKDRRFVISPNEGFKKQLQEYEYKLKN